MAYIFDVTLISTRSLTRRLTLLWLWEFFFLRYFNSQPHEEADAFHQVWTLLFCHISTRSLTRRLTLGDGTELHVVIISTRSLTRRLTLVVL